MSRSNDGLQVAVAQIGARRHYAVPVALYRAGMLASFHTDWCANRGVPALLASCTSTGPFKSSLRRITDRRIPQIPADLIHPRHAHALRMALLRRSRRISNDRYWVRANAAFGRSVAAEGFGQATAVYGFNAAAAEIFAAAKTQGLKAVLDQTMAPWRYVQQLLDEERSRWPDWPLPTSEGTRSEELAQRESQEWEDADLIICGSPFVVDAVREVGGPADKCRVVPYGYDGAGPESVPPPPNEGPLRVLFVGTVDLRKGVPYLLEAARRLDRSVAEFRMVGPIQVSESAVRQLTERIDVRGRQPRSRIVQEYAWADVLVLPTLAEGSANVCFEALAHGVPVVTTPNAGSILRDQIDGWIIPPRSAEAIVACLDEAHRDRQRLQSMSESARERAAEFTWDRYMDQLSKTIAALADAPKQPPQPQPTFH